MAEPFKNALNRAAIRFIAGHFKRAWPEFPARHFVATALDGLEPLELKARVHHVAAALRASLPDDYPAALRIVLRLQAGSRSGSANASLRGFTAWPLIELVGAHGLDHYDASLEALRRLTPMFTAEFAIRGFIAKDPGRALRTLKRWAMDPDEHVRRLVSEGTRPRLPWGGRLRDFQRDPRPVLELLETLADDPSEYVRRSVANNLNDIAKDHPEMVIGVCRRWSRRRGPEMTAIATRALRTLVKAGHPAALAVLGFAATPNVRAGALVVLPKRITFGESLTFSLELQSSARKSQRLVIDYAVHHVKKNGTRSPKVFKLKTLTLAAGQSVRIEKRHALRPITTRRYYAGRHLIELLVNGQALASAEFHLKMR